MASYEGILQSEPGKLVGREEEGQAEREEGANGKDDETEKFDQKSEWKTLTTWRTVERNVCDSRLLTACAVFSDFSVKTRLTFPYLARNISRP